MKIPKTTNRREWEQVIASASREELIGLLAIGHVLTGKEIHSIGNHPKAAFKRVIKRFREAQARAPEYAGEFEEAIQYIRQKWLEQERKEVTP